MSSLQITDRIDQPAVPLHIMTSAWPFLMWGIYAIGMIHPKEWASIHSYGQGLLNQMDRGRLIRESNKNASDSLYQEQYHLSIWLTPILRTDNAKNSTVT